MFSQLMPKETKFFDLFDQHASLLVRSAEIFLSLSKDFQAIPVLVEEIKKLEHEADKITHHTVEMLHKTFITPFDRDDMFRLISCMDDIIDNIDAAAGDLVMYKITQMQPAALELAKTLLIATQELQSAVKGLRDLKNSESVRLYCVNINRLEHEADHILRNAIGDLFDKEEDIRLLIKWKEIYENLEEATDRCEDVANIIEGVILEYA